MTDKTKPAAENGIAADDVGATAMAERAARAMEKGHHEQAGSAEGVGSVDYDEDGAFDVGTEDPDEHEKRAPGT